MRFKTTFLEDFEVRETIGSGSFGIVKTGINKSTRIGCAIKIVAKSNMDQIDLNKIYREIEITSWISHPNVTSLLDYYEDSDYLYLVFDLLDGDLLQFIQFWDTLDETMVV